MKLLDYEKAEAGKRQAEGQKLGGQIRQGSASPTTEGEADSHETEATAKAGEKFGVSRTSVERARTVAEQRPDLLEKVEAGEMTVNADVRQAQRIATSLLPG
ncbi:MAG: hypothetical protein WD810_06595 [Solirubrobacterales bacterium]